MEGHKCALKMQVTDVRKPLMSVSKICDAGHKVTFTKDGKGKGGKGGGGKPQSFGGWYQKGDQGKGGSYGGKTGGGKVKGKSPFQGTCHLCG